MEKGFTKQVAFVAVLFSTAILVEAIFYANLLFFQPKENKSLIVPCLAYVLNSSLNLFIYLATSRNFRRAFQKFCIPCQNRLSQGPVHIGLETVNIRT